MSGETKPMLALTMKEPWASALVFGPKNIENRKWSFEGYGVGWGEWVLIHAGKAWDEDNAEAVVRQWLKEWPATVPDRLIAALGELDRYRKDVPTSVAMSLLRDPRRELVTTYGAIIGAARFDKILRLEGDRMVEHSGGIARHGRAEAAPSWWIREQQGWHVQERVAFEERVYARGGHKLWKPTPEVAVACRGELRAAQARRSQ